MASIFNLQILNNNTYNFETSNVLKNKGTPNQKRQFTNMKELITFLKRVQTIFGHCKYVRNHIRLYCNNGRYNSSFLRFKNVVIMLLFADLKFNKQFNLAKNLRDFDLLFKDIEDSNSNKNNDIMNKDFNELNEIVEKLKRIINKKEHNNSEWRKFQINEVLNRTSLKKLNTCVKNIQNCYRTTHEKLLEHEHTDDDKTQKLKKIMSNTARQQEAILYYGFALNLKYIKEYHYYIRNDLIKKLKSTELFKENI